jgi:predicted Ser/Thr protein kinase
MDRERWERIQSVFHDVVDRPESDRAALLKAACGGDDSLMADVAALLQEDARSASVLDRDLTTIAHQVLDAPLKSLPSEEFGPYRIKGILGEGGMGVVYLAEREDLGSLVAIKILRDAWLSPARLARFESEQRTLANLNHPSIARLYDTGCLANGTPWFVMEYVEGAPLTDYCRTRECSIEERLRLFRSVCEAVQYAHSQAIIHRDLKPSNILVKNRRHGEASGFRHRQAPGKSRPGRGPDPDRVAAHDPGLCGAGAAPRRPGKHPLRRLFPGCHSL